MSLRSIDYLILAGAACFGTLALTRCVKAEEVTGFAYCALYAREATRIDIMHTFPIDSKTANSGYIERLAAEIYRQCVSILPEALPLPESHRSLSTWSADLREWIIGQTGFEPATLKPLSMDETWKEQCAAHYRTWDEATGTVIRRGSDERVTCPCGEEVDCG